MAVKQRLAAAGGPEQAGVRQTRSPVLWGVLPSPHHRLGRAGQHLSPATEFGDRLGRKARSGLISSSSSRSSRLLPDH